MNFYQHLSFKAKLACIVLTTFVCAACFVVLFIRGESEIEMNTRAQSKRVFQSEIEQSSN